MQAKLVTMGIEPALILRRHFSKRRDAKRLQKSSRE
jgi:hypothetical protein